MARQWLIPGFGFVDEDGNEEYLIPQFGFLNEQAGPTVTPLSVSGGLTPTGVLMKSASTSIAGATAPSGALTQLIALSAAGTASSSGELVRETQRALSGGVTPSGALEVIRTVLLSLAGAVTPSGAIAHFIGKAVDGSIASSGALSKQVAHGLEGAVTPSGALATLHIVAGYVAELLASFLAIVSDLALKSKLDLVLSAEAVPGARAVQLDGTNYFEASGAGVIGADSMQFIFSTFLRLDRDDAFSQYILTSHPATGFNNRITIALTGSSSRLIQVTARNVAGSQVLNVLSNNRHGFAEHGFAWLHILMIANLGVTGKTRLLINGVDDTNVQIAAAQNIGFSVDTRLRFGAYANTIALGVFGRLAETYFAPGQYLDPADAATVLKFRRADGLPAYLGADGSVPTGTAPRFYHRGYAAAYPSNLGSGADLTAADYDGTTLPSNAAGPAELAFAIEAETITP